MTSMREAVHKGNVAFGPCPISPGADIISFADNAVAIAEPLPLRPGAYSVANCSRQGNGSSPRERRRRRRTIRTA